MIFVVIMTIYTIKLNEESTDYKSLLNTIITLNGILIAVIATFLYSKILVERTERIQRKYDIDSLGIKLTALRIIASYLSLSSTFWRKPTGTIKKHYPGIDIFTLRSFNYDQLREFFKLTKMGELNSQAFLSVKYLEGNDRTQLAINQNYRKNYGLETISDYHDCCHFIYSYCEEYHNNITIEQWENDRIKDEVIKIEPSNTNITPKAIGELFSNFATSELENLYKLTVENNKSIGNVFYWIFIDMILSSIFLLISIVGLIYTVKF